MSGKCRAKWQLMSFYSSRSKRFLITVLLTLRFQVRNKRVDNVSRRNIIFCILFSDHYMITIGHLSLRLIILSFFRVLCFTIHHHSTIFQVSTIYSIRSKFHGQLMTYYINHQFF